MSRHLYLTGFMGAGKTTVGRALAELLGRPFLDLDAYIEEQHQMGIAEIFALRGELGFRQLESAALREIDDTTAMVVATGGGILSLPENRDWIRAHGTSLWLDASFEVILDRLTESGRASRPLFENESQARALFDSRRREYGDSDMRIEILSSHSAAEVAAVILDILTEDECSI